MLLEKLLTPNDARSCTGPWAAEIIKLIEEDPSVLITPVNEKIPLEVLILQLKNLTNDLCQDSQENVKIVFKALTNGLSVKFKVWNLTSVFITFNSIVSLYDKDSMSLSNHMDCNKLNFHDQLYSYMEFVFDLNKIYLISK